MNKIRFTGTNSIEEYNLMSELTRKESKVIYPYKEVSILIKFFDEIGLRVKQNYRE